MPERSRHLRIKLLKTRTESQCNTRRQLHPHVSIQLSSPANLQTCHRQTPPLLHAYKASLAQVKLSCHACMLHRRNTSQYGLCINKLCAGGLLAFQHRKLLVWGIPLQLYAGSDSVLGRTYYLLEPKRITKQLHAKPQLEAKNVAGKCAHEVDACNAQPRLTLAKPPAQSMDRNSQAQRIHHHHRACEQLLVLRTMFTRPCASIGNRPLRSITLC